MRRKRQARKCRSVKINVHEDFYNMMEEYRKKLQKKGIKNTSQPKISQMIVKNLKRKRKALDLLK